MSNKNASFTVPGLTEETGHHVGETLQLRLHAMNDLHLTLKHAHWNVVGPNFIAVHEMLDPQVDLVRGFADEIAERMAVYTGVIEDHRAAIAKVGDVDPITEDLLIGQTAELEKFQWFLRAHLENGSGELS